MDHLCQAGGLNASDPTWVSNTCQSDWINIIISFFSIYVIALLVVYLRWMGGNNGRRSHRLFKHHSLRACLSTFLFLVHWMEFADALLSQAPSHVLFVPAASFALLIVLVILEHLIERKNHPLLLFATGSLWLANGTTRAWRFIVLRHVQAPFDGLRPLTSALSSIICFVISISEFFTISHELNSKDVKTVKRGGCRVRGYRHDDVHFLSKATFYWMNSLLRSGYKSAIETEDLGDLPTRHRAEYLNEKLEMVFARQKGKMSPFVVWQLFWVFMRRDFCIGGICKLLGDMVGIVGPLGIPIMVSFVGEERERKERSSGGIYQTYPTVYHLWENGWTMAFVVFFASIAQSTLSQASTHFVNVRSIHLKVALQSFIYTKCLRLRPRTKFNQTISPVGKKSGNDERGDEENVDLGILVNLMSNDVTNIMSFFWIGHYIWAIPVKMILIIFLLYMKLGSSAVFGATAIITVIIPIQLLIGKKMSRNTSAILELTDERIQHLSILIEKMKLFKLLGWEQHYGNKILHLRKKELRLLDKDSLYWAILTFFTHASSVLVSSITFGVFYFFNEVSLTSNYVFYALALFNQLMVPLFIFPVIVPIIAEALVSCRRISEFFSLPEIITKQDLINENQGREKSVTSESHTDLSTMASITEEHEMRFSGIGNDLKLGNDGTNSDIEENDDTEFGDHFPTDDFHDVGDVSKLSDNQTSSSFQDNAIVIRNGVFSWKSETKDGVLQIQELSIPKGGITIICGKVGSGKSSLLSAILGQMPQIEGTVKWSRNMSVAYCPQTPWLLNTTIRDNILFGLPFRAGKYFQVINACALKPDLDILPRKDFTEIGENGINLSGGQRQRVAIARALYSGASLLVLDDPFSSLDLSMAVKIFKEGVKKQTRGTSRTVILVTHHLSFLADSHLVVVMEGGKIWLQGPPNGVKFSESDNPHTWKKFTSAIENFSLKEHTAKERWDLIRSVARNRRLSNTSGLDNRYWPLEGSNKITFLPAGLYRKLFEIQSEWKLITHDLPLPTDEFQNNIVECDTIWRKNSVRKREIGRASSLQHGKIRISPVIRQYSSPLTANTNKLFKNQSRRGEFISKFLRNQSKETVMPLENAKNWRSTQNRSESASGEGNELQNDHVDEKNINAGENVVNKNNERIYGNLRFKIYISYLRACSLKIALPYFVVTLIWQIVRVNTDFWLSVWIEAPATNEFSKYLVTYLSLSIGAVILSLLSHGLGQLAGSRARRTLHDSMLLNIIQSSNKILDCLPTGRIFNRFSADVDIIDKKLATTIQRLMQFLLLCSCSIAINAVITPWFIVVSIPVVFLYYIMQMFYRRSSRELQRIDSVTRSPIFSHFAETLSGLSSIRAYKCEDKFIRDFHEKLNLNTNCFLMLNCTNRWLGIMLDYLGGIILFLAMTVTLITAELYPNSVTPSLVGLAMNYTLLLPIYLNWVVKFFADFEIYLGAVERIKQFTVAPLENISADSVNLMIPRIWTKCDIKFENVTLSYGLTCEPVLVDINLYIPQGQKVGICGRSGSGKSTLALSILNMLDITKGMITINGLDITKISNNILKIWGSIIPQDPLFFNGTVRENLDAPGTCTDEQIWEAVEMAHLSNIIKTRYHGSLGAQMSAGQCLSCGEKQLFSLARAILVKSSFLIMDEATSNLDKESEQILMSTAQRVFQGKTLIIIAHRLSTVLECDRIIVLERGKIMEDGAPCSLLSMNNGIFSSMVKSSEEGFLVP